MLKKKGESNGHAKKDEKVKENGKNVKMNGHKKGD